MCSTDKVVEALRDKLQEALEAANEAFTDICIRDRGDWNDDFKQRLTETQATLNELKIKMAPR